jgi:predicted small lipoprotein YifL
MRKYLAGLTWMMLVAALAGCQEPGPLPASGTEPGAAAEPSHGARRYQGEGFSLQVPEAAVVERAEVPDSGAVRAVRILGPEIETGPVGGSRQWSGPAYQLEIITFRNPDGQGVDAWAAEHLRAPGEITSVGGRTAVRVRSFAGDSELVTLYLASGKRVLGARYTEWPEGSGPIARMQNDLHALLIQTLEPEGGGADR